VKTVTLHGAKAAGRVALVDDEDYELVARFRWALWEDERSNGSMHGPYAHCAITVGGKQSTFSLHKLISGYPQTDHIDRDGLNNQRYNLRPATSAQNSANAAPRGATSAFKGVYWHKRDLRWVANIHHDGAQRILGYFKCEEDAARAYDAAALAIQGEYAVLNFPPPVSDAEVAARRQLERDVYAAEREAFQAFVLAHAPISPAEWWAQREPWPHTCRECGKEYLSKSNKPSYYCTQLCGKRFLARRAREAKAAS